MIFHELNLGGVYKLVPEPNSDDRGFFARVLCAEELHAQGLQGQFCQTSISYNSRRGTLRGLHLQLPPHGETKVVRCIRGAIFDVVVDLRPDSRTFAQWIGMELTDTNRHALYIPEGLAHGFQTLHDNTEVLYHISPAYAPAAASGICWADPAIGITWPAIDERIISERDRRLPALDEWIAARRRRESGDRS